VEHTGREPVPVGEERPEVAEQYIVSAFCCNEREQ
jgi:hypothetical protein